MDMVLKAAAVYAILMVMLRLERGQAPLCLARAAVAAPA